ncbi:MAG: hypothetical protein ACE5J0_02450 [Candidatus Paceibacterales bacterium]
MKELKAVKEVKELLLGIFESERGSPPKWLVKRLIQQGVEPEFALVIAQYDREGENLFKFEKTKAQLKFYSWVINWAMKSIIKEYKKAGLSEKDALRDPIRLWKFRKHSLPITKTTIQRRHETLLRKRKELIKLKIPVNAGTLACNPSGEFLTKKYNIKKVKSS